MRDIRFRGKRLDNGEWVYGSYIQRWNGIMHKHYVCDDLYELEVDPKTAGQYTGLLDKNGKEIYEGDIVDIWSTGQHCHGLVKWGQGSVIFFVQVPCAPFVWHLCGGGKNYNEETYEIIGNIHDNPELLGGVSNV